MAKQYNGFRATDPIARRIGDHQYEVFFCIYSPDNKKTFFRFKKGINSLPIKQRKTFAGDIAAEFLIALKKGWNPLTDKNPPITSDDVVEQKIMTFSAALDYALEKKRLILSKYSMYDYDGAARFMKAAAKQTGYLLASVDSLQRKHIREIVDSGSVIYKWSAKSRNKHLERLRSLLSVIEEEDIIPFNPCRKIKDLPEPKTIGYKRLTDDEKKTIAEALLKHEDFFDYLMFIYHTGIRRTELLQVKVRDINMIRRELTVPAVNAKTNTERIIPLTDDLVEILIRRQIRSCNINYFLFSKNFKPGDLPVHPNTPTSWWKKLVQEDLGIDCKMYSLKHKGADDKIKAGIDLDILRSLYGHKSKQMTEVYAREVRENYKEKIITMSPAFTAGKVVNMKEN